MRYPASPPTGSTADPVAQRGLGLSGRITLSWTMAGAIAAGGFFFAGLVLTRQQAALSPFSVLLLAIIGAALGFVHGSLLAVVGRPAEEETRESVHHLAAGAIWAIPGLAGAGVLAMWIAIGPDVVSRAEGGLILIAIASSAVGAIICVWAAIEGHRALRNAFSRWPDRRFGVPVVLTIFAGLAVAFFAVRPEIWWTDFRVTGLGALLLALGVTIWVAIPVTWMVLHALHGKDEAPNAAEDGGPQGRP